MRTSQLFEKLKIADFFFFFFFKIKFLTLRLNILLKNSQNSLKLTQMLVILSQIEIQKIRTFHEIGKMLLKGSWHQKILKNNKNI